MRISIWAFVVGILAAVTALANQAQWEGRTPDGKACRIVANSNSSGDLLDIVILESNARNELVVLHRETGVSMNEFSLVSTGEKRSLSHGRLSIVAHQGRGELSFRLKAETRLLGYFSGAHICQVQI